MFLKIKNLEKHYKKNKPLIKSLDFNVNKGDIVSFIGESGSGKTTFLRCLAGLEDINDGSIELNKVVLNSSNTFVESHNRKIGFVFQDYPLFPHLNVIDNITFNLDSNFKNKVSGILELTGLNNLTKSFPHELSGGEQQRVSIARVIIREPDLLLLDEPFSNLDSNIKLQIKNEIYNIIKNAGITTILVTHDIKESFFIADKILIFKAGILQQYDEPFNIYCNPSNCYCAKALGDLNMLNINEKTYYLRPENINIVNSSKYKGVVSKCSFVGKEFQIIASFSQEKWTLFSKNSFKVGCEIFISFDNKDLIQFDPHCENHFTHSTGIK
jgi:iron(III) transport system ATP-binding protein